MRPQNEREKTMIYRVTQNFGSNQGRWQSHREECVYVGDDKTEAFEHYLQLEPASGEGCPGDSGYTLRFETADISEAEHPDSLEWNKVEDQ